MLVPTVIWKEQDAVLSDVSVATHVTVVVPEAKVDPDAGLHVLDIFRATSSSAVAENVAVAPAELLAAIL